MDNDKYFLVGQGDPDMALSSEDWLVKAESEAAAIAKVLNFLNGRYTNKNVGYKAEFFRAEEMELLQ